ncbi:MAG TPA: nodulation protein NfeD [Haloferula sp.]
MNRWLCLAIVGLMLWPPIPARGGTVGLVEIEGAIGPATAEYVARAVTEADRRGDECVIVRLDTPGGLLDSTKGIVQTFYASKRPIVVFVGPAGATATSAGCFITLAADVAAMAPGTSIGAAHPVSLGGGGTPDETMKTKIENFAASYIEAIAQKRQRNAGWASEAVRNSASITAEKALELKVVDLLAADLPNLLQQLDGRRTQDRTLATAAAELKVIPMNSRERVFQVIWRPEVMFVLMLAAIYGIIGELSNPGAIFPGVVGVVALILALYMGAVLPINVAGLALIFLALGLFVADVFAPTHGVLTAGGILAFLLGGFMLFDQAESGLRLSWTVLFPSALATAAFFAFVVGAGLKAQFLPVKAGAQTMLGQTAAALTRVDASGGTVFVEGEYWHATSDSPVDAGSEVEITGRDGLNLQVKPQLREV